MFARTPESSEEESKSEKEPSPKQEPNPNPNNPSAGTGQNVSTGAGGGSSSGSTSTAIATTPKAVEELLLGCSKRSLVLNDVLIRGGRVALEGSAAKSLVGKKVKIVFDGAKQVATATVQANGQFSTTAPLAPARLRDSNSARYLAESGSQRSLNLKLTRRLILEPPKFSGGASRSTGQVVRAVDQADRQGHRRAAARMRQDEQGADVHASRERTFPRDDRRDSRERESWYLQTYQ